MYVVRVCLGALLALAVFSISCITSVSCVVPVGYYNALLALAVLNLTVCESVSVSVCVCMCDTLVDEATPKCHLY